MNTLRTFGLIGVGMLLAVALLAGAGLVLAQGPGTGPGGMMGGTISGMMPGMMGNAGSMAAMHAQMTNGQAMTTMHAQMHDGEAMPEACQAMMNDPALGGQMMGHMMAMMQGDAPMSLAACQQWMSANGIPADVQAQCLATMAQHHPTTEPTPTP